MTEKLHDYFIRYPNSKEVFGNKGVPFLWCDDGYSEEKNKSYARKQSLTEIKNKLKTN